MPRGLSAWPGNPNRPCAKAYATLEEQGSPLRLIHPMVRGSPKGSRDPEWRRIGWDEAYRLIAGRLREVRERYGPHSVMFYAGNPKEMRLPLSRLASAFGSANFATEDSLCYKLHVLASLLLFGVVIPAYTSLEGARSVLLWGANPAASRPYMLPGLLRMKVRGARFVVVDPRRTPTAERLADVHLKPLPGTDGALALGMINVMISRGLYDHEFVESWVHGFDALREYASRFTPERVEAMTRVPARDVENSRAPAVRERRAVLQGNTVAGGAGRQPGRAGRNSAAYPSPVPLYGRRGRGAEALRHAVARLHAPLQEDRDA